MKIIKNTSLQGINIPFGTPEGTKTFFFAPKQEKEVPDTWKSKVAENLVHRRMVRITNVEDSPVKVHNAPRPFPKKKKVTQPVETPESN